MTDRHLDEGILQAYTDGELSHEQAAATAAHLAACEACSAALAEVEGESSFFAAAFAPDESLSVPTAALRARLNAAVAQLEASKESEQRHPQGRSFGALLASFSGLFAFTPRTAAAFATLLVAVAAGIIYISSQRSQQVPDRQGAERRVALVIGNHDYAGKLPNKTDDARELTELVSTPAATPEKGTDRPTHLNAKYKPRLIRKPTAAPSTPKEDILPGEKEYRTAIASLEKTIKLGGDEAVSPALRADYERNLALIDSAITQTRQVAAQNPKDKDVVGFLMAAYQSKVELLTRVADQAQVAALGR